MKRSSLNLKNKLIGFVCIIVSMVFALAPVAASVQAAAPVQAATSYTSQYNAVLNYLLHGSAPSFGSVGGEWKVFALSRSLKLPTNSSYFAEYYTKIENMVRANGSATLDSQKSSENSRLIIALTSIGRDARNVAGYDLTSPLSDFNYVKKQGINGPIFALLALNARSVYGNQSAKQACIDYILEKEISGGGWSLTGSGSPDPDITAMAITALAPYSAARPAVNRGVSRLSAMQLDDGSFASGGTSNCESCAQVLLALSTLNIDADSDPHFIKNGNSLLSALLSFYKSSAFSHTPGGSVNAMATEQAAYSLCAYDRYKKGNNTIYNMNDVTMVSPTNPPAPTPTPTASPTPTAAPTNSPKPTNTPTPAPTNSPKPTNAPTSAPTSSPKPTNAPTAAPTPGASASPTVEPTVEPSVEPSEEPSLVPETEAPSATPAPTAKFFSPTPYATYTPVPSPIDPGTSLAPIQLSTDGWVGRNPRSLLLKWVVPAFCGVALVTTAALLLIPTKKKKK